MITNWIEWCIKLHWALGAYEDYPKRETACAVRYAQRELHRAEQLLFRSIPAR